MPGKIVELAPISVAHSEMEGSPTEDMSQDSFSATRTLVCAWPDRITLAQELLAGYEVTAGALRVNVGRLYPHQAGVYAVSVDSIEPYENGKTQAYNGDSTIASHAVAKLTVRYENKNFDPTLSQGVNGGSSTQIAEESTSTTSQFLSLPEGQDIYLDTPTTRTLLPRGSYPGVIVRGMQWNYTLNQVRAVPSGWRAYAGYVNSDSVTSNSLGLTFAPETLLFLGATLTRTITTSGPQAWKASLALAHRESTWNLFPDSYGSFYGLYTAITGGTQKKPYPSTSFVTNLNLVT